MNDYAVHAGSLAAVQARLGDSCPVIQWNDHDFKIIPGSAIRRKDLGAGGFSLNADFSFEALVGSFGGEVVDGVTLDDASKLKKALLQSEIGYLENEYKAVSVSIRPGGLQIMVECNSLNQGA